MNYYEVAEALRPTPASAPVLDEQLTYQEQQLVETLARAIAKGPTKDEAK